LINSGWCWLLFFRVTAVVLSIYGDTVGVSMMAGTGIALLLNYLLADYYAKRKKEIGF